MNGSTLEGTPQAPGNFVIAIRFVNVAAQWDVLKLYLVTIGNAAGQAPAVSMSPDPVSIYYEIGSPSPAPTRVFVQTTSGSQPVQLHLSGAPWASLDAVSVTASTQVNLNVNAGRLAAGTASAMVGAYAPGSVNADPVVPVLLNVSVAPVAAPGAAAPVSPIGVTTESRPILSGRPRPRPGITCCRSKTEAARAASYRYRPADAGCADGLSACAVVLPRALAAGPAQWKVLTWNAAGYGPWSAVANVFVYLSNGSLAAPRCRRAFGSDADSHAELRVEHGCGATWYAADRDRCRRNDARVSGGSGESCTSATCIVTPATGMPLGAAQWRVRAGNAAGGGAWSALIDFTVTDPAGPPGKPVTRVTGARRERHGAAGYLHLECGCDDELVSRSCPRSRSRDSGLLVSTVCGGLRARRRHVPRVARGHRAGAGHVAGRRLECGWLQSVDATEPFWLEIADPAAGVTQPVSPAGPTMSALVQYRWSAVPGAVGYRVMIHNVGSPAQYSWITPADAGCAGESCMRGRHRDQRHRRCQCRVAGAGVDGQRPWRLERGLAVHDCGDRARASNARLSRRADERSAVIYVERVRERRVLLRSGG